MTSKRNIYLKMKSLEEARQILFDTFDLTGMISDECVEVTDSVGRILSEPVYATMSSPNFHSAAMDGIAVNADSTFGASESAPKTLIIGKDATYINTGHVMPEKANSVIMIEHIHVIDEKKIEIEAPAFPWQHVRRMGEDIVATELVFPRNHKITPYCIGALISAGVFRVNVRKKPSVFIQPTGSELVDHQMMTEEMKPGQVLESNSHMLGKLVESSGGNYFRNKIIKDDMDSIADVIRDAAEGDYDLIFIVGGSSAGSKDFSKRIISELGEVMVHGVTMMPGKPVIIGQINQKPVFGMPGYPVSAIIAFDQLVRPFINKLLHQPDPEIKEIDVIPTRKIPSKLGLEEFLRVKLGSVGDKIVATPLPRGAGCITSFTEAHGIIRIPNHSEGISDNKPAKATLLRPLSEIKNTIVAVGSHDNTMDVLTDLIHANSSRVSLSSSHVGSMGGLMAVKKGLCHVAGTHLLNPEDGSYNISYIQKYLPDTPVKLVHLAQRDQGLIVQKGNPNNIGGIKDLAQKKLSFINRQIGSGTRILFDFKLNQMGIRPADISGYENEEFTHMAVAVAVLNGSADAGLGIFAAAKALNLDFIPVVTESYDLVIPADIFETDNIRLLMNIIASDEFKSRVKELGGYHLEKTGDILWTNI